tara:strand:+ start:321 stop:437 length:117 start_codon:yes stop_codon:yes gene_type:complete
MKLMKIKYKINKINLGINNYNCKNILSFHLYNESSEND